MLIRYKNRARQASSLAALVAAQLMDALRDRDRATIALPGGGTPGAFLHALADADIDWSRIEIMPTDERFVPETSSRSNMRMLRQIMMQGGARAARLIPFYAPAPRPEDVITNLGTDAEAALPLDVCVLGMGADMHTASLFPGADGLAAALDPEAAAALFVLRAPNAPEPRISLGARALLGAPHLHLLLAGPEKLAALEAAEQPGAVTEAPVRLILRAPQGVSIHYTGH